MPIFGNRDYTATEEFNSSHQTRFEHRGGRSAGSAPWTLSFVALIGVGFSLAIGSALILLRSGIRAMASEEPPAPVALIYVRDGAPARATTSVQYASRSMNSRCAEQAERVHFEPRGSDARLGSVPEIEKAVIDCYLSIKSVDLCEPLHRWRLGRQTAAYLDEYFDEQFLARLNVVHLPSPKTTAQNIPPDVRARLRELYGFGLLNADDLKASGRPDGVREAFRLIVDGAKVQPMKCPNT